MAICVIFQSCKAFVCRPVITQAPISESINAQRHFRPFTYGYMVPYYPARANKTAVIELRDVISRS